MGQLPVKYQDLRDFLAQLEQQGSLKRIAAPVSPHLEITEIADRVLRAQGPALLFEHPVRQDGSRYAYPVLANLFGTTERVALGMGASDISQLREIGKTLAYLKEPEKIHNDIPIAWSIDIKRDDLPDLTGVTGDLVNLPGVGDAQGNSEVPGEVANEVTGAGESGDRQQ